MPLQDLCLTVIQPDIIWEDKAANLLHYAQMLARIEDKKEVVALPEMFSTGFSMRPESLAEGMNGPSVAWMAEQAARHGIILAGSLIIAEEGRYYNRFIWMQPDGTHHHYDKRHLFAFACEDRHYHSGDKKVIVQVKGWKINLQVCYDLRFPVWARQPAVGAASGGSAALYDVLLYLANWPQRRSLAWTTLLQARAIENQCYVAGINRVGIDGNGIAYPGDSRVIGPGGEVLWSGAGHECAHTIRLSHQALLEERTRLPFLKDADNFLLL